MIAKTKVNLFGASIDPLSMDEAVETLMYWVSNTDANRCRYVVTPNVDHTRLLHESEAFRNAYAGADMTLADGMPVVWASRLLGQPIPERVTGADLVPGMFSATDSTRPLTAFLLGALPGVADRAAKRIEEQWPYVKVTGAYSPPFGFERDAEENERILKMIADVSPDVLVIGVGAPKQELWIHKHRDRVQAKIAFCVGATIDFLAGEKPRAPLWMQNVGLEWCYRLASEPRRLVGRYAKDAVLFPQLVWREWTARA